MIVVDRIEGDQAVLEIAGKRIDVPVSFLPAGTKEGDRFSLAKEPRSDDDAQERLQRLRGHTKQGPGEFDL